MSPQQPVLPEDATAATLEQVTGWVSRDGRFYGSDEALARWVGATHVRCSECGTVIDKGRYTICPPCLSIREAAKYAARERRPWDGVQMLYSERLGHFYGDPDDADNHEVPASDLRLVLCDPVYAQGITGGHFCDDLPEDGDVPEALNDAMGVFNAAIEGIILSWRPGKYAWNGEVKATEAPHV